MVNAPGNTIAAAYFGLSSVNIPNGQALFTFRFNVTNTSTLIWDLVSQGACQYSNFAGDPMPAQFVNGGITAGLPTGTISSTPFICSGQPAEVSIHVNGVAPYSIVYNDGVNPNVTVNTSTNPYVFTTYPASATTYTLVSIGAGACTNPSVNATTTTSFLPTPQLFDVIGGGGYCAGQTGIAIGLSGSQANINYELFLDGATTGVSKSGSGGSINFGIFQALGTYTVSASNNCGSATMNGSAIVNILPLTQVSLESFPSVCISSSPFLLTGGLPEGGNYSGSGVIENTFYPEIAGTGFSEITYTASSPGFCSGSFTQTIQVIQLPELNLYYDSPVCLNSDPVALYGYPQGGVYSGAGVNENFFYPGQAGSGVHAITYTYTNESGCTNSVTSELTVTTPSVITFNPLNGVCHGSSPVELAASPAGGWFEGDYVYLGESSWMFNPTYAGPATYPVTYFYTDEYGCTSSATQDITVYGLPVVSISGPDNICANANPVVLNGTPEGGIFSGSGVVGNTFDPSLVLPGSLYPIDYSYTDENGCSNTSQHFIFVNYLPYLEIYLPESVCANSDAIQLIGYPGGGTFSGTGVIEDFFFPSNSGAGTFDITYTLSDQYNCTSSILGSITVNPAPANLSINMPQQICANSEPILLAGEPAGGVFNGAGVYNQYEGSDFLFYPSWVGAGNYTITYLVSNEFGCFSQTESQITVNAIPEIGFDLPQMICQNSSPLTLNGNPAGGVFSGSGVFENSFDPSQTEAGSYIAITYTYTSPEGCAAELTQYIFVNQLMGLSFNPPSSVCENSEIINLNLYTYPSGGIFSGAGITESDYNFNPALAGIGTHEISYVYSDIYGCTSSTTSSITVNPTSQVSIIGLPEFACATGSQIELNGSPVGGTFDGDGVYYNYSSEIYEFWPNYTFEGPNSINYTFTNEYGCVSNITGIVTVVPAPVVEISPVSPLCESSAPAALVAYPSGGTFSGLGVFDNMFYPAVSGIGNYTITYTYTNENGCTSTSSIEVIVNSTIPVNTSLPENTCISSLSFVVNGYPEGGVFSGNGMIGNIFDPASAGIGVHEITYSYTNESGCTGSITETISVNPLTELQFPSIPTVCTGSEPILLTAYPEGGYFTGIGVYDNYFYPGTVEPNIYIITYTFTNISGCTSEITQTAEVTTNTLVTLDQLAPVCADGNPVVLNGQPEGGVYSGPGVVGNLFYPTLTGGGNFTISYTYGDLAACGSSASQDIIVIGLPSLTSPSNVTVSSGNDASFTVVSANAYFLQWQVSTDGGVNWNNLSNDGTYNGVNSDVLGIFNVSQSMSGQMFHCLAFGDCPSFATSDAASLSVESATITITAGIANSCPGEFVIPVSVENFSNVASLSLSLTFDQNLVSYIGYSDLNTEIQNGFFSINVLDNQVKLGYFNIAPANIGTGLLVNYIFAGVSGNSVVSWDLFTPGNCQLVDLNDNVLNVNYVNGSISVTPLPAIFEVMGGGVYCENGNGSEIMLSGSETGVSYFVQLDNVNTGNGVAGTGEAMNFGYFFAAGNYTIVAVNDLAGCTSMMSGSASIGINPSLLVSAGNNAAIGAGESTVLTSSVSGGTAPYTYLWTPATGLDDATIANPTATPIFSTTYTLVVTDYYGCSSMSTVTVNVIIASNNITGVVSYLNDGSTPMNNVAVNLFDNLNSLVATTTTDANGNYGFSDLSTGSYHVTANTTKAWGGGNAADGLLMLKHFTGNQQLTGMYLTAGDVTGNGKVNSHDALNTVRRFLGMISNFLPISDWLFETPSFVIDGVVSPVVNIHSLCASDVNGDYIPPFMKPEPTINLNREGSVAVNANGNVVLPIISEQNLTVGAISMKLEIPSGISITKIVSSNREEVLFNVIDNELRIGWYDLDPLTVSAGECLLNIYMNVGSHNDLSITMVGSSVLSDENAVTIKGANLIIPKISSENTELSITNYPNPVSSTTTVSYSLPESGKVNIKLFSIIGEEISELLNSDVEAGNHNLKFDAGSISQGVYILKIELNGQIKTHLFSISK